jgi:hypothetical protein
MKLRELKTVLDLHSGRVPRFILPDGDQIPVHYHLTEVGHVAKNFIDCGGTTRQSESCVLQLWVSKSDPDHRLDAGKFAFILSLGERVLPGDDLDVEVEYGDRAISQFPIESARIAGDAIEFTLGVKHTDCLAREKCGVDDGCCGTGPVEPGRTEACC